MQFATALARFLPTDPGYAPFGLTWLRGLNVLHFALVGLVGLMWGSADAIFQLAWNDAPSPSDFYRSIQTRTVRALIVFTPMLLLVIAADNLTEAAPRGKRIARIGNSNTLFLAPDRGGTQLIPQDAVFWSRLQPAARRRCRREAPVMGVARGEP